MIDATVRATFGHVNVVVLSNIINHLGGAHIHDLNSLSSIYNRSIVPTVGEIRKEILVATNVIYALCVT